MTEQGSPELTTYDFRKPTHVAAQLQRPFKQWQERACRLLRDNLQDLIGVALVWQPSRTASIRSSDFEVPEGLVTVPIEVTAPVATQTQLAIPCPLALAWIQASLGEQLHSLPVARDLSTLERTLFDLVARRLGETLAEVRPPRIAQPMVVHDCDYKPQLVRLFPGNPNLLTLKFTVSGTYGSGTCYWLWREEVAGELFVEAQQPPTQPTTNSTAMAQVAQRLPVDVVIRLGEATLHVTDLAELQVGDVIVLNQRVSDQLVGLVADHELLHGWAGRLGQRQAFQIRRVGR